MNLTPYLIAWAVLGLALLVIAIKRRAVAEKEDDSLHLSGAEASIAAQQVSTAKRLERLDRWCKVLTIILIVGGIALGAIYGMQMWETSATVGLK